MGILDHVGAWPAVQNVGQACLGRGVMHVGSCMWGHARGVLSVRSNYLLQAEFFL